MTEQKMTDKWTIDEQPWMIGTLSPGGKRIGGAFIISRNGKTVAWADSYRLACIVVARKGGSVRYKDCTFVR